MKRITFFTLAILFIAINAFGQETIRYVNTKVYDADYVPHKVTNAQSIELKFYGDHAISQDVVWGTINYKYSYSENGYRVYYMVATDLVTGQEHVVKDNMIMVSNDRTLINIVNYTNGKHASTCVYEKKTADRPRGMLR